MRLRDEATGDTRTPLLVMLAVVGFVLIIGCVNAANLLLARSTARQREFAVRRALGAGRGRLVAKLLTESILLALAGGAVGLLFARLGVSAILKAWPAVLPRVHQIGIDTVTLVYALLISLLAGVAFGLAPAWRSGAVALDTSLREGSSTTTAGRGRHRLQRGLVVAEIALALVVLTGAGLLVRSFVRLRSVDPGLRRPQCAGGAHPAHAVALRDRGAEARLLPAGGRTAPAAAWRRERVGHADPADERRSGRLPVGPGHTGDYVDIDQDIVAPGLLPHAAHPADRRPPFTDDDRANTQLVAIVNVAAGAAPVAERESDRTHDGPASRTDADRGRDRQHPLCVAHRPGQGRDLHPVRAGRRRVRTRRPT